MATLPQVLPPVDDKVRRTWAQLSVCSSHACVRGGPGGGYVQWLANECKKLKEANSGARMPLHEFQAWRRGKSLEWIHRRVAVPLIRSAVARIVRVSGM